MSRRVKSADSKGRRRKTGQGASSASQLGDDSASICLHSAQDASLPQLSGPCCHFSAELCAAQLRWTLRGAGTASIFWAGALLALLVVLYLALQFWVFSAQSVKREKKLPGELDRPVVPGQPRLYTYEVGCLRTRRVVCVMQPPHVSHAIAAAQRLRDCCRANTRLLPNTTTSFEALPLKCQSRA